MQEWPRDEATLYITVHLTISQMKLFVLWNRSYDNVPCIKIIEVVRCPKVLQLFLKLSVLIIFIQYIWSRYMFADQELLDIYTLFDPTNIKY